MANTAAALLRQDELWTVASKLQVVVEKPLQVSSSKSFIPGLISAGSLTEISGRKSSGRTSISWHVLAQATGRGEVCAVVDLQDSFDPASAQAAGVKLEQLVWVRCQRNAQHTIRAADLLLHAGGFGVVLLDLCEATPRELSRIPVSYWHRLRRAVEHTPTALLVCADSSEVKCSFVNKIALKRKVEHWAGSESFLHFEGWETAASSSKASHTGAELLSISAVA